MTKEQKKDFRKGKMMVMKSEFQDDNGIKKTVYKIIKFIRQDEHFTEFENLDGEIYSVTNSQNSIKSLWFSEDFYLKVGLKHCDENILKKLDLNYCYYNLFESQKGNNNFYVISILKNENYDFIQKHFIIKKDNLENLQGIINNSSSTFKTFEELFRNPLNEDFKIEFLKNLNLDIQYNPINHQPKYKWSKAK